MSVCHTPRLDLWSVVLLQFAHLPTLCLYAAFPDTKVIKDLETSSKEVRAYNGTLYLPGVVGLNNIKANDYCNVVLQALSHVTPIRNYFLDANSYAKIKRRPGDQNAHELLVVSDTRKDKRITQPT